jgi:hypothetical protein
MLMMNAEQFSQNALPNAVSPAGGGGAGASEEWAPFPGGELEGRRPKVLCAECRERQKARTPEACRRNALCFQCYRAGLERDRAIRAAGQLDTASEGRFQHVLPLEPINRPRLDRLRMERAAARARARMGAGRFVDKRRHAQIEARHALLRIAIGVKAYGDGRPGERHDDGHLEEWRGAGRAVERQDAAGAGGLAAQLPDSWLPFVATR